MKIITPEPVEEELPLMIEPDYDEFDGAESDDNENVIENTKPLDKGIQSKPKMSEESEAENEDEDDDDFEEDSDNHNHDDDGGDDSGGDSGNGGKPVKPVQINLF